MNNHRIQKFDLSGKPQGMIDCYGSGESRPAAPAGIAVDRSGNIYVTDISNDNIQWLAYDPARGDLAIQESTNITLTAQNATDLSLAASTPGQDNSSAGMMALASPSGNGPSTYINLTGTAGNGSWYRSNVTVTLSPYAKSGTLIGGTYYRLDNGQWIKYEGPFGLTGEGTTTVSYYSVDNLGNAETEQSTNVRIDKTPPAVTGTRLGNPGADGWYTGSVIVHFNASLPDLSGVVYVSPDQTISENGISEVVGSAYDLAGNIGTCVVTVKIDNKPPTTNILLSGMAGGNGWYTSDVRVNFSAGDGESGVNMTEYSLDGGIWKPATPFVINKEGVTTVYYRSTDRAENVEPENTMMIKIDKTAPGISGAPDRDPEASGWYISPVTVTFAASDIYSGVMPGSVTQPVTLPLKGIPLDGPYQSVTGTATDNAGNTATVVVGNLNIDMYPPTTTCTIDGAGGGVGDNTWYRTNVTVTLFAKDAGSGVNETKYNRNNTGWNDYHPFVIPDEGTTTVSYGSTDNVGHVEPGQTTLVRIDKTPPKVTCVNITQPNGDGWYTEPVIIHFTATDDRSGVVYVTPDITLSSDGANQTITGYAMDVAGNTGSVTVNGYNVDLSAPVTTCILNRTPNGDGWFSGDVSASLSSSDSVANSLEIIKYSFDGTDWQTYDNTPLPIHDEGVNVLYYYSTDNFSHVEPMNAQNIRIDNSPPTLAYQISGGSQANGWYTQNVTVHFIAADAISGIKSVTPDVHLTDDGAGQVVRGTATDFAGHSVSIQTTGIDVDTNPPVTMCTLGGTMGDNGWYKSSVAVTLDASDGDGSGINYTLYRLDNGPWATGNQLTISDDGPHAINYQSVDNLNNTEAVKTRTLKVDKTAPIITGSTAPGPTQYGWYNSSVVVHFNASDSMSGLVSVSPDVTLSGDGADQTVTGTATDNAGNSASCTMNVNIDKTPPATNYTLEGSAGVNGWNTSDVKVTFSADDLSLLNIWHSFDNKNWSASNPFTIKDEGCRTIYYYAEDKAGNKETPKSFGLKIDKTAPTITYNIAGTPGLVGAYRSDVTISFGSSDGGTSGLANAQYSLDGNTWKPLANITLTAEGDYNIPYYASDNAGNKASGVILLTIDKTVPAVNVTTPQSNAEDVFLDSQPAVTFNELMDPASLNNSTFTLTSSDDQRINGSIHYVQNGSEGMATFIPEYPLSPYTIYTASLSTDIKDPAGNHLASPYKWTFTTGYMDSAGNESATPMPESTVAPTGSPTPKPGGIPIIGQLPSIPILPVIVFLAIIAVGVVAFIYLTRMKK
jgi:hypothetical protein